MQFHVYMCQLIVCMCVCVYIYVCMFILEGGQFPVEQFSYEAIFQGTVTLGAVFYGRSLSVGSFMSEIFLEYLIKSQVGRSKKYLLKLFVSHFSIINHLPKYNERMEKEKGMERSRR